MELHDLRTLFITDLKLRTDAVEKLKRANPKLTLTDYTPE